MGRHSSCKGMNSQGIPVKLAGAEQGIRILINRPCMISFFGFITPFPSCPDYVTNIPAGAYQASLNNVYPELCYRGIFGG